MLDLAIIGAGPAGMSAALNAKVRNKNVEIFGVKPTNTWLYKAENINNHLGFENYLGKDLMDKFINHIESLNIKINYGKVLQILSNGDYFMINFENEIYQTKSIILATGIEKKYTIKNESDFLGKSLSYCATCDGMMYKNKKIIVYGESVEAEEDLKFLSEICESIIYFHKYDNPKFNSKNITYIKGKPTSIIGEKKAEGVVFKNKEYLADGLFFINDNAPTASLIDGLQIENSAILVDKSFKTNINGVYAAGDCTGWPFQVSKAVGEGLVAAQNVVKYLDEK